MTRFHSITGFALGVACILSLYPGCSSGPVPLGETNQGLSGGGSADAGEACACPNGEKTCSIPLPCPSGKVGECVNDVAECAPGGGQADAGEGCACPNGEKTCSIPLPCPSGEVGECVNGVPECL